MLTSLCTVCWHEHAIPVEKELIILTASGSEDVHSFNVHVINFNDGVLPYMPNLIFQKAATEELKS